MSTHATPSCLASARAQGQACECGARLFGQEGIYDEFVKKSIELAKQRKVGRGLGQELRAHHPGARFPLTYLTNFPASCEQHLSSLPGGRPL